MIYIHYKGGERAEVVRYLREKAFSKTANDIACGLHVKP